MGLPRCSCHPFRVGKPLYLHRYCLLHEFLVLATNSLKAAASYLVDTYQSLNGASAIAANGLLRYTFGAVFPLFTLQMYHRMGIPWATSFLAFVTITLMPIPWVLFRYGKGIRGRSSYETLRV
jgi:hypothetical protein